MDKQARLILAFCLMILLSVGSWIASVMLFHGLPKNGNKFSYFSMVAQRTYEFQDWRLLLAFMTGFILSIVLAKVLGLFDKDYFGGGKYKKFLRGTKIVPLKKLSKMTADKSKKVKQVTIADCPMPVKVETLHTSLVGSTGTGKSVTFREILYKALLRGDRLIVLDPNGDMVSKFYKSNDIILNPYDARSEGWSIFNEIHNDYDYDRYSFSIVPRVSGDGEEWNKYARLLMRETMKKLKQHGDCSVKSLLHWTTVAPEEDLKILLKGTPAESLFVGAEKALASARFTLADKIAAHVAMPEGEFSIREWLSRDDRSNLYITWRQDQADSLKPLVSAWADVICTSILSLGENEKGIWLSLDELASLDAISSLEDALTKGRKHGLRILAGIQSTAQLDDIYGEKKAQTLRSCFRNIVVLGGSKTDAKTAEEMSLSLGEHEVERENVSKTIGEKRSRNKSTKVDRERVVLPSEIASLPELTGYISFAGDYPIARFTQKPIQFQKVAEPFVEVNKLTGLMVS